MNLRTKHILSISGIVLASGAIGYLLGRMHKPKSLPIDFDINDLPEPPAYKIKTMGLDFKDKVKEVLSNHEKYEYFETDKGSWGVRTKIGENPVWSPNPFGVEGKLTCKFNDLEEATEEDRRQLKELKKQVRRYTDGMQDVAEAITEAALEENEDDEKHLKGLTSHQYIVDELPEKDDDIENLRTQGETEYTSDEPYIVEASEVFAELMDPDEIETLSYYKTDNVLADSYDELVMEKSEILGENIFEVLRNGKGGDVIYVRNPMTRRDYEIIIVDASYEQEVLGADEEQYKNAVKFFKLGDE